MTFGFSGSENRVAVVPAGLAVRFDRAVRKKFFDGSAEHLFGEITIHGRTYPMKYYLSTPVYPDGWRRMYEVFAVRGCATVGGQSPLISLHFFVKYLHPGPIFPGSWENPTLERYLEAMAAWLGAHEMGKVPEPSWELMCEMLEADKIYE